MKQQHTLMKFDPCTGEERPYPSDAENYRKYHGRVAWLYNPWTGEHRHVGDIGSDVQGCLIIPDGEEIFTDCDIAEIRVSREMVDEAAQDAEFSCIDSCCGVPLKFCSSDQWKGDLNSFSICLAKLIVENLRAVDR